MRRPLRPHQATYGFRDAAGDPAGEERMELARSEAGWRVASRLELTRPLPLATDLEWHLEPDLATRILYLSTRNAWGEEHRLELAITGNGVLASREAPDGPSQVEMGWGPEVELDHLGAAFTTILLARWDFAARPARRIRTVFIGAEDLVPEPLEHDYRVFADAEGIVTVERAAAIAGRAATIRVAPGGVALSYSGLFEVREGWRLTG
ncbi:MAG TPA: putative glycolipid-binding domain-containing protein [Candidatus Dormibacteraeota bacterium]|nr:putative glycolipid-binding domain-containing protein [Candidatus Dormibacteraeota bacterium]